ncbi:Hypothetical protein A7982_08924 [Minicystis rosea]|nr:Hypothetical protein A7982_08924 [Minicystis rosea]
MSRHRPSRTSHAHRFASNAMVLATAALALTSVRCEQLIGLDDFSNCPQDPQCPSCSDGKKNGDETDVDCGGTCPAKCAASRACNKAGDCESGVCTGGNCAEPAGPGCNDGEKNGNETDKDCGGGACPGCKVGEGCVVGTDCESLACGVSHICVAPKCDDMVKNGSETDVDCGGSCPPCAAGEHCAQDDDCTSNACDAGICTECMPGATRCSGIDVETCDAGGTWQTTESCAYVCDAGNCIGVCLPSSKQCSGNMPQTCDAAGQWQNGTTCSGDSAYCAAGACLAPPSCQAGATGAGMDCGPGANESCCTSLQVTGGSFFRSYDGVTFTSKTAAATVSSFQLDKYEVTVGRFRQFVSAWVSGWRPAAGDGKHDHLNGGSGLMDSANAGMYESGWDTAWSTKLASSAGIWNSNLSCSPQTWTPSAGSREKQPINCVNWYEAYAFCIWDGGFLPTEAEWNYAAAGGVEQRVYPWSSPSTSVVIDCTYANYYDSGSCYSSFNNVGSESPKGDGRYGQADLAGNVYEWSLDWFAPYVTPCSNCAYLASGSTRVRRGGVFDALPGVLVTSYRGYYTPASHDLDSGLRCARSM